MDDRHARMWARSEALEQAAETLAGIAATLPSGLDPCQPADRYDVGYRAALDMAVHHLREMARYDRLAAGVPSPPESSGIG